MSEGETAKPPQKNDLESLESRILFLELRVAVLQKDAELFATFCSLAALAALFLALRWYQKEMLTIDGHIPGVVT